jgi:hypothetical protein
MAIFWPAARIARSDGMVTAIWTGFAGAGAGVSVPFAGAAISLPCKYPLIVFPLQIVKKPSAATHGAPTA